MHFNNHSFTWLVQNELKEPSPVHEKKQKSTKQGHYHMKLYNIKNHIYPIAFETAKTQSSLAVFSAIELRQPRDKLLSYHLRYDFLILL